MATVLPGTIGTDRNALPDDVAEAGAEPREEEEKEEELEDVEGEMNVEQREECIATPIATVLGTNSSGAPEVDAGVGAEPEEGDDLTAIERQRLAYPVQVVVRSHHRSCCLECWVLHVLLRGILLLVRSLSGFLE